ncbi:MAG: hypothetical protein NTX75_01770 [Proteobacteria bacterium]|nr:hypothetical protein [Pseudomonadota bacterium]
MCETEIVCKLWTKMRPQIEKLAKSVEKFSTYLEPADFINQAYIACDDAIKVYDPTKAGKMTLTTFTFWYIQKHLYKMVEEGGGEVVYIARSPKGKIKILTNSEYRKKKKKLELGGYVFTSERTVSPFPEWDKNENENGQHDGNSHFYFDY